MSTAAARVLMRLALWIVPLSWRDTVAADLHDECDAGSRSDWWCIWHALRVGVPLRIVVTGQACASDLRYAIRSLIHAPWFTAGAVFTFAIGIGVNLAVFSMLDRMLFRPMPYARPSELVLIQPFAKGQFYTRTAEPIVIRARAERAIFADIAVAGLPTYFTVPGEPEGTPRLSLTDVSYNTLGMLGLKPLAGRDFTRADAIKKSRLAILTYEAWQSRFAGSPTVVGQSLGTARPAEIIGVLQPGFVPPTSFWASNCDGLFLDDDVLETSALDDGAWPPVARLQSGVSLAQAQAAIDVITARVSAELQRSEQEPLHVAVAPLREGMFRRVGTYLWLIFAAAAMVLLIACANLSSLLLTRGRSREHIVALRVALGASRGRLVATGLMECALVAAAGALGAFVVLELTWTGLVSFEPAIYRRLAVSAADPRVLVIAIAVVCACVLISGVWPTVRGVRVDVQTVLQRGTKTGRRTRSAASRSLLIVEAALGMLLVSGATLTGKSLVGVLNRDLGFSSRDLVRLTLPNTSATPMAVADLEARVIDVVRRQSDVEAVGGIDAFRPGGVMPMRSVHAPSGNRSAGLFQVTGTYFDTVKVRVIAGRTFGDDDVSRGRAVAVVSAGVLPIFWPGATASAALGKTISVPGDSDRLVVGVVADQRPDQMSDPYTQVFIPYAAPDPNKPGMTHMEIVVRMRPNTTLNVPAIRGVMRTSDPRFTLTTVSATSLMDPSLQQPRFQVMLFASFAICALILAAVGLYSVASLDVALRRYEMGVRLALGASSSELRRLVLVTSMKPVVAGIGVGLVGAWWAAQFMDSLLVDLKARDPLMIGTAAAILLGAGVLAAWLPAQRAARTDPATVLRAQ